MPTIRFKIAWPDGGWNRGSLPNRMTVAFHCNQLCLRGTEVATFDYARFNEEILGNKSVVFTPKFSKGHEAPAIAKFKARFETRFYWTRGQLRSMVRELGAPVLYSLKGGTDDFYVPGVRNCFHGVFEGCAPHGDRFAYISEWLAGHVGRPEAAVVPHMVWLPAEDGDLREELGIPKDATVFGRHGGVNTFDLKYVQHAVYEVLNRRADVRFLFLNTARFGPPHERIIHLPGTSDMRRKTQFINSCDAMIHARLDGESFGLAVGEFSIRNKPVFTALGSNDKAHYGFLGESGFYYDESNVVERLTSFDGTEAKERHWDRYSERFSPEPVMKRFAEVFLS